MSVVVEGTEILELGLGRLTSRGRGQPSLSNLADAFANPLEFYQRAERPLPAYAGHLAAVVSTRILAPFDSKIPVYGCQWARVTNELIVRGQVSVSE